MIHANIQKITRIKEISSHLKQIKKNSQQQVHLKLTDAEFQEKEESDNYQQVDTQTTRMLSSNIDIDTKLSETIKNGEIRSAKTQSLKNTIKRGNVKVKFKSHKNVAMVSQGSSNIRKEIYIVRGDKITSEERIKNFHKEIIYPFLIIPCKHQFKLYWDSLMGFLVLYTSLVSPLDIAFEFSDGPFKTFYVAFDYFLLSLFACDILINFRTTYYDEQQSEILNSKMILKNYLQNYNFYIDLISTIPISEISEASSGTKVNNTYTRIFKQLKLFRIFRLAKLSKFISSEDVKTVFTMSKMFFLFIIISHWCTCLWYYIARQDYDPNNINDYTVWIPGTLRQIGLPSNSPYQLSQIYYEQISDFQRYSYCLYSLITLILGNDLSPTNLIQAVLGIVLSIGGQFLMSMFFGEVSILIFKLNQEQTIYTEKLDSLESKIQQNKFPDYMKVRIIEYFEYCWQKKISRENQIDFSFFSRPLETQMHYYLKKEIIRGVPFFSELDAAEILWIIKGLRSEIFLPDDYIIRQGEMGECMYFMTEGTVRVIVKDEITDDIKRSFNLKKKQFFGEVALLTQSKRTSDVVALDFCILESFTRESFIELQEKFPDIQQRLQYGFSHYKLKSIDTIVSLLKQNAYFNDFQNFELKDIIKDFLELKFIDSNRLILKPKKQAFAWYLVLTGSVYQLTESPNTQYLLRKMLVKKQKVGILEQMKKSQVVTQDQDLNSDEDIKEETVTVLKSGDTFGEIPFKDQKNSISHYFVTQTGCQLITLTQEKLLEMKDVWGSYYNQLYNNDKFKDRRIFKISNLSKINNSNNILISRTLKQSEFEASLQKFEIIVKSQLQALENFNEKLI